MTSKKDKPKRYRNLKPAWKPGQAGNPQGRPPRDVQQRELLSQLADHGDEALATVIAVMRKAISIKALEQRKPMGIVAEQRGYLYIKLNV